MLLTDTTAYSSVQTAHAQQPCYTVISTVRYTSGWVTLAQQVTVMLHMSTDSIQAPCYAFKYTQHSTLR